MLASELSSLPHHHHKIEVQVGKMVAMSVSEEREISVAPTEAWKLYGTLQLPQLVLKALPGVFSRIDILRGDGGAGTIIHVFLNSGAEGGLKPCKEEFTVVDDERRLKVSELLEGGWLDLGFTHVRVKLEVIEKEGKHKECITRVTVEFEFEEENSANLITHVSFGPFAAIMQVAADYLHNNNSNNNNNDNDNGD